MEGFTDFTCFYENGYEKIDCYLAAILESTGYVPQSFVLFSLLQKDGSTLKKLGPKHRLTVPP